MFRLIQDQEVNARYVGVPGMNSVCKALCQEPGIEFRFINSVLWHSASSVYTFFLFFVFQLGIETRFGHTIGRSDWLMDQNAWSLKSIDGQDVGHFMGVVATDKNTFLSRFTDVTGKQPPIGIIEDFRLTYMLVVLVLFFSYENTTICRFCIFFNLILLH